MESDLLQTLSALLDEVQYILSIDYNKERGLILSEDTVEGIRSQYLNLMDSWETIETVLTSATSNDI